MNQTGRCGRAAAVLAFGGLCLAAASGAPGQSIGPGASPGRAAYRPASQWNDGPYYTVPHWDPWAPRAAVFNDYYYNDADAMPYTNAPRGRFNAYDPGVVPLYPYAQGFSPFAGYSDWYKEANNFEPGRRDLAAAAGQYFRSSPIPADPRYLAPSVAEALYAPEPTVPAASRRAAARPAAPRLEVPRPESVPRERRTVVYRFGQGR